MGHALITGGAGFIGSHLVDRLLSEGWRVTAVDDFDPFYDRTVKETNIAAHRHRPGYRLVEADVRDLDGLRARLDGSYDVIVHLAARPGARASIQDPVLCQEVNIGGTQNMLECARRWGVRQFVFASASSVYGVSPRAPWREDEPMLLPISPYAGAKRSAELLGHVYSHLYGIRFLALRLFTVYGPRQRPDQALHRFAQAMLSGRPVVLAGDGSTRRDCTFVGDIVEGIRAAMGYGDLRYEVINLGSNHTASLSEMVAGLERVLGVKARIEHKPEQPGDVPRTWANISKAQRLLGYHPRTSFEEGLSYFAAWLTGTSAASLLALHRALTEVSAGAGPVPMNSASTAARRGVAPLPDSQGNEAA
ncbi:MAG TPA: GDP-mannose 4,6-dehydratase [Bryobacteraceae bacterium]|nr:GDP-mannose 4,6-dehydratase [Bryobacteraceae bacterium]